MVLSKTKQDETADDKPPTGPMPSVLDPVQVHETLLEARQVSEQPRMEWMSRHALRKAVRGRQMRLHAADNSYGSIPFARTTSRQKTLKSFPNSKPEVAKAPRCAPKQTKRTTNENTAFRKGTSTDKSLVEPVSVGESFMLPVSNLHVQVWEAVRLVGEEIKCGVWPLSNQSLLTSLPIVLEQFIREIFLPHLQGRDAVEDRVYVATMLAIREVLTQNSKELFVLDFESTTKEEVDFGARVLATGIILAANERLMKVTNLDLVRLVNMYDDGAPEFKDALTRMGGKEQPIAPNGKPLDRQEAVIWKAAFNMAREKHPLMGKDKKEIKQGELNLIQLAEPTACYVAMVEALPPTTKW